MPRISRTEGYRRSVGKEQAAIDLARDLLGKYGVRTAPILDRSSNHLHGDLGAVDLRYTVEVKGQPTDHVRYQHNFVEVLEVTSALQQPHHADGFDRTAAILGMTPEELAQVRVNVRSRDDPDARPLGRLLFASASLESFTRARFVAYVNTTRRLLYLYGARRLLRHIEGQLRRGARFSRGAGQSNDDTLAVFTGHSCARWSHDGQRWVYRGPPYLSEEVVRDWLRKPASWPNG